MKWWLSKANTRWSDGCKAALSSRSTNDDPTLIRIFHIQTQQENIREVDFYFPNDNISISEGSLYKIFKLEPIGNIKLCVIF